jgi:hypothetical protein
MAMNKCSLSYELRLIKSAILSFIGNDIRTFWAMRLIAIVVISASSYEACVGTRVRSVSFFIFKPSGTDSKIVIFTSQWFSQNWSIKLTDMYYGCYGDGRRRTLCRAESRESAFRIERQQHDDCFLAVLFRHPSFTQFSLGSAGPAESVELQTLTDD